MTRSAVALVLVIFLSVVLGSTRAHREAVPPGQAPQLVVVAGARDVRHTDEYDGAVHYVVADPYPASTIGLIEDGLRRKGWEPTSESVPETGPVADARAWWSYGTTEGGKTYQRRGSWKNKEGDLVTYFLLFEVSTPNAVAKNLSVSPVYMTNARVRALRKAAGG